MACNFWKTVLLGNLIDIKHGYAFKGEFFRDTLPGDILLTPGNFAIGGGFKSDKFKYYLGEVPEAFVLTPGDLLVTMTDLSKTGDTLGYPALVPKSPKNSRFLHNQRLGRVLILPGSSVQKDFLYYLLCTKSYKNEILASATGTTVKHTSPDRIKAFRFSLPPVPQQQAIAHILGTLDDKIELNQQMNRNLEVIAQTIFKSWFIDFDPVRAKMEGRQPVGMDAATAALFPDSFEDSPLGEIPKGWRMGEFGEIAHIVMGQSPPGETYNELEDGLPFYQGVRDFGFRFPTRRVYCNAPKRYAEKADVLFSVRAPVGNLNVAVEHCSIGRGLAALRLKANHGSFLYYFLKATQSQWEKFEAEGTVFGSVSKDDIYCFKLIVPVAGIIEKFNYLANSIDAQIESNVQESLTLSDIRDSLLPKLMSGEIRVKEAEEILEDVA